MILCQACSGKGYYQSSSAWHMCNPCGGMGRLTPSDPSQNPNGSFAIYNLSMGASTTTITIPAGMPGKIVLTCSACNGEGILKLGTLTQPCPKCA